MLQRFALTAFVVGTLLTGLIPAVGLARDHSVNSGGGRNGPQGRSPGTNRGQSFSGGSRSDDSRGFSGGNRDSGRQSFVSPRGYDGRRGYSGGPSYYSRGYIAPRSYGRQAYRGYYDGGLYLGYGAPYGYAYDPGYTYDPGYAYGPSNSYGPAPAPPACTGGSYDRYGAWVPNPNCYSDQQQYPPQSLNPNQRQYLPPQQYDPNRQQYPQPQNYDPSQPQRYNR